MPLIPSWAPNVHPMLIHFPIVLVFLAALTDIVRLFRSGTVLSRLAVVLYLLGASAAVVAVLSGRSAERLVYLPGMANGLVEDHEHWALATTGVLFGAAGLRVVGAVHGRQELPAWRLLFAVIGLILSIMVQQTAERGARLVYEQGVGVIPGPGAAGRGSLDPAGPDQASPR